MYLGRRGRITVSKYNGYYIQRGAHMKNWKFNLLRFIAVFMAVVTVFTSVGFEHWRAAAQAPPHAQSVAVEIETLLQAGQAATVGRGLAPAANPRANVPARAVGDAPRASRQCLPKELDTDWEEIDFDIGWDELALSEADLDALLAELTETDLAELEQWLSELLSELEQWIANLTEDELAELLMEYIEAVEMEFVGADVPGGPPVFELGQNEELPTRVATKGSDIAIVNCSSQPKWLPLTFLAASAAGGARKLSSDINMDGVINHLDVGLLNNYLYFGGSLTETQKKLADVNGDGQLNPADLYAIEQALQISWMDPTGVPVFLPVFGTLGNNRAATELRYDDLNRVTNKGMTVSQSGTTWPVFWQNFIYREQAGFKSSDQVYAVDYTFGGTTTQFNNILSYTYDTRGNITSISKNGALQVSYVYDQAGQLYRVNDALQNETVTYEYDAGGNIKNKRVYAYTTGNLGSLSYTIPYTYGDANWKDTLTAVNGAPISYDAIGNPTDYNGWTYTWEGGRQLKSMAKSGMNLSFTYNDEGIRTSKTVNGTKTNYTLVDGRVTAEETGGSWIYYRYDGFGEIIALNYQNTEYFYVKNIQGDIIAIVDENGNLVVEYVYDAWGNTIGGATGSMAATLGAANPFRYRSYFWDAQTGLYYLQSRYYSPDWGRFINADVPEMAAMGLLTGDVLSTNLFAYCGNNPVNFEDRTGMFGTPIQWAMAAVGAIAGWYFGDYVARKLGYSSGWKYWAIRGGVVIGGAVIGWFAGTAIKGIATAFLKANPAVLAKLPGPIQWFLGLGGTGAAAAQHNYGILSRAMQWGIQNYNALVKAIKGTGLQAHHLIEQRFGLGREICVALTKAEHQAFTNHWRQLLPYGKTYTLNQVWEAAKIVYAKYPALLEAVRKSLGK